MAALPSVMLEGFDESTLSDEAALPAVAYRHFLFYYLTYFNSKARGFAKYTQTDVHKALDDKAALARQRLGGQPYQYALARLLLENCAQAAPASVRSLYGVLAALPGSEAYAGAVKQTCGEVMARKDAPVVAQKKAQDPGPNVFFFHDQQGQPVTLDAYKGKVVYLDVWASWCGPCRAEFPHSKKLHDQLTEKQKKQVVFLYLSIDDTEAAWKNALNILQLPGEQGWSKGGWNSKVVQYFGIQGIPRYVLIDKNGQIADANAKRPSNAEGVWQDILKLIEAR